MRSAVFVAALLAPVSALAGGVSWSFTVIEVRESAKDGARVVLVPTQPGSEFPGSCTKLQVSVRYKREPFWRRTWSRDFSRSNHKEALARLRSAAQSREPFRFGSIGTGLVASGSDPCVVQSRGLAVLEEGDGTEAVYSFHSPI